jgi:hypothetical protein
MKKIVLLFFALAAILTGIVTAADCTNCERYYGNILPLPDLWTATRYNKDINDLYAANQSFDGTCLKEKSVIQDSLDATTASGYTTLYKSLRSGCAVTSSYVGPCNMFIGGNDVSTTMLDYFDVSGLDAESEYYIMIPYTATGTTLGSYLTKTVPEIVAGDYGNMDASGNRCIGVLRVASDSSIYSYVDPDCHHADFRDNNIHTYGSGTRIANCVIRVTDDETSGHTTAVTADNFLGECYSSITNSSQGLYAITFKTGYWYEPPSCQVFLHNETNSNVLCPFTFSAPSASTFTYRSSVYGAISYIGTGAMVRCTGRVNF